ncbi:3-oxoacyl-[acyl-carrier-protein] reductase FabG-like [Ptychodera flava]|uniref:3-oxoacyl-[acyl-carrier-protein] reductase FabG-like n=1 Tax=Ptychodera flava TaxID=63121 RepID=UPI00396A13A3
METSGPDPRTCNGDTEMPEAASVAGSRFTSPKESLLQLTLDLLERVTEPMSSSSSSSLDGKVALVTGSSDRDNIGFAIAESLAKRGCSLVLSGSRRSEMVESVKADLGKQYKTPVRYIAADLNEITSIENLRDEIKNAHSQGIDILVNNAVATPAFLPIESVTMDIWMKNLRVNLTAPFLLTQLFLSEMKVKGWGRIINISSVYGLIGTENLVEYVTTKHGLNGLTKRLGNISRILLKILEYHTKTVW